MTLEITFRSRKLSKEFISNRVLVRRYGDKNAKVLAQRMLLLRASRNLQEVSDDKATKFHQLHSDRDEQFSVSLFRGKRLVFEVGHPEIPRRDDGGINLVAVTAVKIIEIVDYH